MQKVSVLIPAYNSERLIPECINSAINQSYQNIEIIIVDDGSTDNTFSICNNYAKSDKRLKIIRKSNGGVVSARIEGTKYADGDFVLCLDSDDFIDRTMIEQMLEIAKQSNADVVCTGYIKEKPNESAIRRNYLDSGIYKGKSLEDALSMLIYSGEFYRPGIMPFICGKLIKTDLYKKYQKTVPIEINRGEDVAVMFPLLLNSKCIVIDNEFKLYHYRKNSKSICHSLDNEHFEKLQILYNYLDEKIEDEKILKQLNYYKLFGIVCGIDMILNSTSSFEKASYLTSILKDFPIINSIDTMNIQNSKYDNIINAIKHNDFTKLFY